MTTTSYASMLYGYFSTTKTPTGDVDVEAPARIVKDANGDPNTNGDDSTNSTTIISSRAATPLAGNPPPPTNGKPQQATPEVHGNGNGNGNANELTCLLGAKDDETKAIYAPRHDELDPLHPLPKRNPTVKEFYFTANNPTVQRYYKFAATPITPIVALHKKPGTGNAAIITSGVTGLLRRSAVVPSHGTDPSGDWILVSVGGRSGWARKKMPEQHFSGFSLSETFHATEGWMGNHAFLCKGKIMLGSDAPSLLFTSLLLIAGVVMQFAIVLPRLQHLHDIKNDDTNRLVPVHAIFWLSVVFSAVSMIALWISATMDPGILPPVSSPIKAPVPPEGTPLGGPMGYRYCSTCNVFRPPRSKHCNSCNVCVSKFDQYVVVVYILYMLLLLHDSLTFCLFSSFLFLL
jgi:hypothetical protein